MHLDKLDKRILAELQSDGSITNLELADKIGLSPSLRKAGKANGRYRHHRAPGDTLKRLKVGTQTHRANPDQHGQAHT